MRALLLAAGLGSRLRPLTFVTPKCLVKVKEKPLLSYWLDLLLIDCIDRILINTHYLSEIVIEYINQSPFRDRIDIVYEPVLLGTGGTILKNKNFFLHQAFLVAHADNLTKFNLPNFIKLHEERPKGIHITMMIFKTDTPENCGIIELSIDGIVQNFHEKVVNPPNSLANAAVYIFEPSVIEFLASLESEVIDISTQVIPAFLGRIQVYHNTCYHRDIGTIESLTLAESEYPSSKLL